MLFRGFIPKDASKDMIEFLELAAVSVYEQLDDPIDKFIVMGVFDIGYPKESIADCLGISYTAVYKRIEKIRTILNPEYKPSPSLKITTGKGGVYKHYYQRLKESGEYNDLSKVKV